MVRASVALGIIAGVIGLLLTPVYLLIVIAMLVITAIAQTSALGLLIGVFIIAPLMAILGIIGGVLSRRRPRLGGVIMLAAGALPLLLGTGGLAVLAGEASKLPTLTGGLVPFLVLYSWCILLVIAGVISLTSGRASASISPACM